MADTFTKTHLPCSLQISALVTLHHFNYAPDFLFTGEKHDFWELAYVENGDVGVMAEATGYALHSGEAIFHKPNEYHNIWANSPNARVIIISFDCHDRAMDFFKGKILSFGEDERALLRLILEEGERLFAEPLDILYQTRLILSDDAPFGSAQLLKSYLEALLIRLIRRGTHISNTERTSRTVKHRNEEMIADSIIRLLTENLFGSITLDDVCSTVCFSKSYLKRLFKSHTGFAIMDYYHNLKIEKAKLLLGDSSLSVTRIAEMLGFSSIHYFSRMFRQRTGISPSEFKNKSTTDHQ